ncbi:MAG: hypothetical protein ACK40G_02685 [Cytophagaceae bacterium]
MQENQFLHQVVLRQSLKLEKFELIVFTDLKNQTSIITSVVNNLKTSLRYTTVNISNVKLLRKSLDDIEGVIKTLEKILEECKEENDQ